MNRDKTKSKLVKLMQAAYSGELAAALAYGGHWRSLKLASEIEAIKQIEEDEWKHRERVGEILDELGVGPSPWRERIFFLIGSTIAVICRFCGHFCAAYFAGILEKGNVNEYNLAHQYATELEMTHLLESFREMEKTEAEHEVVLFKMVENHGFLPYFRYFFKWGDASDFLIEE
ncbi:MAG: ferritin-like domain-containing protein [Pyrinomonadaceae bacterium]|nr:ferritin-like domain-containing protein [Pyrinomonadaceae bacterium]